MAYIKLRDLIQVLSEINYESTRSVDRLPNRLIELCVDELVDTCSRAGSGQSHVALFKGRGNHHGDRSNLLRHKCSRLRCVVIESIKSDK